MSGLKMEEDLDSLTKIEEINARRALIDKYEVIYQNMRIVYNVNVNIAKEREMPLAQWAYQGAQECLDDFVRTIKKEGKLYPYLNDAFNSRLKVLKVILDDLVENKTELIR